jgi:WD40 repeat protein
VHRQRLAAVWRYSPKLVNVWFHNHPVTKAEFSSDGRKILTVITRTPQNRPERSLSEIQVTEVGKEKPNFHHRFNTAVHHAEFSPDGRYVLTASGFSTSFNVIFNEINVAQVWDAATRWQTHATQQRRLACRIQPRRTEYRYGQQRRDRASLENTDRRTDHFPHQTRPE